MKTLLRRPIVILLSLLLVISLMFGATTVFAAGKLDWGNSSILVKKDAGTPYGESALQLKSDDRGNLFVVWTERTFDHTKLYVQRYDAQGQAVWKQPIQVTQNDVSLSYAGYAPNGSSIVLTNDGGLILVWMDNRNNRQPDIFAQKLNADGSVAWADGGIPVYIGPGFQQVTSVITDNEGGAEVIWVDQERPGQFMQRIGSNGKTLWQDSGISLDTITGVESKNTYFGAPGVFNPYVFAAQSDNNGGFYLTWNNTSPYYPYDMLTTETTDTYTFVQRINRNGQKAWQQNISIKQVQPQYGYPQSFVITTDGGLILSQLTEDLSKRPKPVRGMIEGPYQPIYQAFAWKVSPEGKLLWGGTKPFFTTPKGAYPNMPLTVVPSGSGFISIIGLSQYPGGNKTHIISLDASGTIAWHNQTTGYQNYAGPAFARSDGKNGIFTASWLPPSKQSGNKSYMLVQRFGKDGKALWEGNGIKFVANMNGGYGSVLEPDGSGGVFVGWRNEKRVDPSKYDSKREYFDQEQSDLYVQHVKDDGSGWPDVAAGDWSYPFIDGLVKAGAIKGYDDGTFRPNGYITRAEFAKLAVIALDYDKLDVDPGEGTFEQYDFNEIGKNWAKSYILKAIKAGVMKGYYSPRKTVYADRFKPGPIADMAFRPNARITRAEVAAIIFRAKNLQAAAITQQFADVPTNHWAFQYVDGLRKLGIAAGYGDNEFRPMNVISRKEASKMIFNVMPGTQQ